MAWANGVGGQRTGMSGEQSLISAVWRRSERSRASVASASGRGRRVRRE